MEETLLMSSGFYSWFVLPFLIFIARVADVSIGTVRLIFVARGFKYIAPIIGFFEVLIWLLAIGQIMKNLSNPVCYIAFAGGFAMGNFVGICIAEKLSLGLVLVRVVTQKDASELVEYLKCANYGVTSVDGHGTAGEVKLVFTIVPRQEVESVIKLINSFDLKAFYSIEEVSAVERGVFPAKRSGGLFGLAGQLWPFRKGK
ncbi:MAG: DUF2179 domain-containing protein [Sedimentisphaerales bacterium]|nr:DUF2179 domain-containing protein [Sedimentisphaerales bacterium]